MLVLVVLVKNIKNAVIPSLVNMQKFTPFSNNIVFLDTEFSTLDPYKGEILSIGIVKLDGSELYLELEYQGETNDWVKKNILPTLTKPKISRQKAIQDINEFIGDQKPYVISYVNQFDTIYLYKLTGINGHPFFWLPIDFASILFSLGIQPENYNPENPDNFLKDIDIDITKYHQHNALDDAKLLREVYLKMINKNE